MSSKYCSRVSLVAVVVVGCAVVSTVGCERSGAPASATPGDTAALPPDLFLNSAPGNALSVREAKANNASGGELIVRGRIGGRRDPFVTGSAVFLLVDKALPTCTERHGDGCRTPWDYCCEPADELRAATATVQVVDNDGNPLKVELRGRTGLEPGAEVIVVGHRADADGGDGLVINATGIYAVKR